jgi:hypothetical protein
MRGPVAVMFLILAGWLGTLASGQAAFGAVKSVSSDGEATIASRGVVYELQPGEVSDQSVITAESLAV